MTDRERFFEMSTRWMRLRMQFMRWIGEQPTDETLGEMLARIRAARGRRAARRRSG